jgi:hypothetical protein
MAKWTSDGEVVILGRNDDQIKLRGQRLELGEIENAIQSHEGITRTVMQVRKIRGQDHLCAYFTANREIDAASLRKELSEKLPKYMIPTAYVQLDVIPSTPNGKVDVKALPEAVLVSGSDYQAPSSETEAAFCEIFAHALGIERVGATDNFFDLGGTSLLVARVTADAMNKGYDITFSDVFQNPTPSELVKSLGGEIENAPVQVEYDYEKINSLLSENNIKSYTECESRELGNICLTGATGYLGIHVLREFIENRQGAAYCIVRGGKISAENRLKTLLAYYFEDSFDELFGSRIFAVDGDIRSEELFDALDKYPIDTYINCAANVKHFSEGTDIEDINVKGVQNAIRFCKRKVCRLIQVSTCSISGLRIDDSPEKGISMSETMLFFGQDLSNKYTHSKFIAERFVLESALDGFPMCRRRGYAFC